MHHVLLYQTSECELITKYRFKKLNFHNVTTYSKQTQECYRVWLKWPHYIFHNFLQQEYFFTTIFSAFIKNIIYPSSFILTAPFQVVLVLQFPPQSSSSTCYATKTVAQVVLRARCLYCHPIMSKAWRNIYNDTFRNYVQHMPVFNF